MEGSYKGKGTPSTWHAAFGLCKRCYDRERYRGNIPPSTVNKIDYPAPCKKCGVMMRDSYGKSRLQTDHSGFGMCRRCYMREKKSAKKKPNPRFYPRNCERCGTVMNNHYSNTLQYSDHQAKGLCHRCYITQLYFDKNKRKRIAYPCPCRICGVVMNGPYYRTHNRDDHNGLGLCRRCYDKKSDSFEKKKHGGHRPPTAFPKECEGCGVMMYGPYTKSFDMSDHHGHGLCHRCYLYERRMSMKEKPSGTRLTIKIPKDLLQRYGWSVDEFADASRTIAYYFMNKYRCELVDSQQIRSLGDSISVDCLIKPRPGVTSQEILVKNLPEPLKSERLATIARRRRAAARKRAWKT